MALARREKKLFVCEDNHKRKCEGWTQRTFENSNIGQSGPASNIYNHWKCLYLDDAGFCEKGALMSEEKDWDPDTGEDIEMSELVQAQTCEVCTHLYSYKDCDNWSHDLCKFHGSSRIWTHKRVPVNSLCCHFKDKRGNSILSPEELEKLAKLKEIMEQKAILTRNPQT